MRPNGYGRIDGQTRLEFSDVYATMRAKVRIAIIEPIGRNEIDDIPSIAIRIVRVNDAAVLIRAIGA